MKKEDLIKKCEQIDMILSIKEAINTYKKGCATKCNMSTAMTLGKAVFAGFMIGLGAAGSSVAAHNISNVGVARLVAAVVFPVGLMMVILMGSELFTGDCLLAIGIPEKDISIWQLVRTLVLVFLGNFIGGVLLSVLIYLSGQLNYSNGLLGAYTIKVALAKVNLSPVTAFSSGALCNFLVCAAVIMAVCSKDATGKLLVSFFVIMLFVTSGFEHCVANMYYITAGLVAKTNPAYVSAAMENYGLSVETLNSLNVRTMLVNNLIPVTIGNIVGGSFFVGLPLYYLNRDKTVKETVKEAKTNDELCDNYVTGAAR